MADRIKGITVVIGGDTTGLSKALQGVNKQINTTQRDLKDVERLLKMDPTNVQLLEQRHRLLGDAVQETKTKLDSLKQAEAQVQAQFKRGEVSQQQYEGLQREIAETEKKLEGLQDAAKQSNVALSRVAAAANKFSGGAKKVSEAFAPATAAIGGLATAAVATVPATEELRSDLAKLDANAQENAVSVDATREAWRKLAVQSGETDSAVEAVSNVLQAGFTESNLQQAVEGLAGAAQRFPDTLKIESLADSLQETLATGEATGAFGELLDRLGIGAENFSAQLQACTTEAEKQNLVLQMMADAGLNASYEGWEKNNEAMIENQEANLRLQEAMAGLAETILPVMTAVTEKISELINWFTSLDSATQTFIGVFLGIVAAVSPVAAALANIGTVVSMVATTVLPGLTAALTAVFTFITGTVVPGIMTALSGLFAFIAANPIVLVIAAIVAAIVGLAVLINTYSTQIREVLQSINDWLQGVFATNWTEIFGPILGEPINAFMATVKSVWDGIMTALNGIITFVTGIFSGNWRQAWEGIKSIFKGVFDSLVGLAKSPLNTIIGLVNAVIGGINAMINGLNSISIDVPEGVPVLGGKSIGFDIPNLPSVPYLAKGGTVLRGSAVVGEAGPELLTVGPYGTRVQPLTSGTTSAASKSAAGVTIEAMYFYGYQASEGRSMAREINRELGRML